jgi:hypothetical protein
MEEQIPFLIPCPPEPLECKCIDDFYQSIDEAIDANTEEEKELSTEVIEWTIQIEFSKAFS